MNLCTVNTVLNTAYPSSITSNSLFDVILRDSGYLATKVATGELKNPHEYLMAAQEASISTQVAVAVRNKALEAFNEIMRMPL